MLIWFVIIYWVISVGIGLWAALRVRNTTDFAVAGRSLPFYIVTATVFATGSAPRRCWASPPCSCARACPASCPTPSVPRCA